MYRWRRLSEEDQAALLDWRKQIRRPWHSPPHFVEGQAVFHLTAACYEHADVIGVSMERMSCFSEMLMETIDSVHAEVYAWCALPNHYHLLVKVPELKEAIAALGKLHGKTSHTWNGEDDQRGRRVWSAPADRLIRSDSHYWATMNYIHHNPVKHGYVNHWQEWPFGSANGFLDIVGREEALRLWKTYPVLDYGKGWDD